MKPSSVTMKERPAPRSTNWPPRRNHRPRLVSPKRDLPKHKRNSDVHQDKAGAHELLQFRYQELGKDNLSQGYQDRARLENATSRGLTTVVTAYETKLKTLEAGKAERAPSASQPPRRPSGLWSELSSIWRTHMKLTRKSRQPPVKLLRFRKPSPTWKRSLPTALSRPPSRKFSKRPCSSATNSLARLKDKRSMRSPPIGNTTKIVKAAELAYDALSRALTGKGLDLATAGSESSAPLGKDRTQHHPGTWKWRFARPWPRHGKRSMSPTLPSRNPSFVNRPSLLPKKITPACRSVQ